MAGKIFMVEKYIYLFNFSLPLVKMAEGIKKVN